jgi:DNA-binding response OmpR family regulator
MVDFFQILLNSLPEIIGGLTVATIIAILGYIYKKVSRNQAKEALEKRVLHDINIASQNPAKQDTSKRVSEIPRILYVDDEIERTSGFLRILEKEGFKILAATTVSQAVDVIKSDKAIDLAIVDLMLPQGDEVEANSRYGGLRVIEVAKKTRTEMPIICFSAVAAKDIEQKLEELKIAAHIRKPINYDEFVYRIKLILLSYRQPSQQELILDEIGKRKLELNGANPHTRIRALWALGELGHHDPEILKLLNDVEMNDIDEKVKKAAIQAKKKIKARLQ